MSASEGRPSQEWLSFTKRIAEVTRTPAELIRPDARVVEDLGLDSLALAELSVSLREAYETAEYQLQLESRRWEATTIGQLYEECTGSRAPVSS